VGAIAGIGAASGPVVGGLLVTAWSWRGVFFLNLPFALAAGLAVAAGAFLTGALVTFVGVGRTA